MAALRTPVTGCPWDLAQSFATIAPYTVEEAYEVADAIERHDLVDLREELGDLLLQVVYHARLAEEEGAFDFGDVVLGITGKMIRRHPHVFGNERGASAEAVKATWERIKAEEKAERARVAAEAGDGTERGTTRYPQGARRFQQPFGQLLALMHLLLGQVELQIDVLLHVSLLH
jgi:ATP diphosphatase